MVELKNFFCQFPNPWALRVSGMGGYTSKCEKKSKSLHPNVDSKFFVHQLYVSDLIVPENGARLQHPARWKAEQPLRADVEARLPLGGLELALCISQMSRHRKN